MNEQFQEQKDLEQQSEKKDIQINLKNKNSTRKNRER